MIDISLFVTGKRVLVPNLLPVSRVLGHDAMFPCLTLEWNSGSMFLGWLDEHAA